MEKKTTRILAECAILIALGTVLSLVRIIQMPFGGDVTLFSLLPLIIICWRHGRKWGFLSALIFSFLQMLTGVSTVSAMFLPGDSQMLWWKAILVCLIDYVLAYTCVGFASFFRGKNSPAKSMAAGALVGVSLCYHCHIISGAIFYGAWAEWFFTDIITGDAGAWFLNTFNNPTVLGIVYSVVYNGVYMIPEIALTSLGALAVGKLSFIKKDCSEGAMPKIEA